MPLVRSREFGKDRGPQNLGIEQNHDRQHQRTALVRPG